jgi:cytidylate kinase
MSSRLRIAISGKSGCGNTTVSRFVAGALGLRVVNYTFRDLARDRGMSLEEIARAAEEDPQYDLAIDRLQVERARRGGCVLGSRLAIWLLRDTALTVYLEAVLEVRAARISRRENMDYAACLSQTMERDKRDRERFLRLYGYDVNEYGFARLIVDAERLGAEEVARKIVEEASRSAT